MSKTTMECLREKICTELECWQADLLAQGAQAVAEHAEEWTVRIGLAKHLEEALLAQGQLQALLEMEEPLSYIYSHWEQNHPLIGVLQADTVFEAGLKAASIKLEPSKERE